MPGLVPGIHALLGAPNEGVDGRNKSGHDELWFSAGGEIVSRSLSSGRPKAGPVGSQ
jgi:hypothetical protein